MDMGRRGSGILLPILSVPSPYGIGDFGPGAYKFADFLAETKQSFWQILPLTPTDPALGNSPYNSSSAFAGNKLFISPDLLLKEGLLKREDVEPVPPFQKNKINYLEVIRYKEKIFDKTYEYFKKEGKNDPEYEKFCQENSNWLEDYALFIAAKTYFRGKVWNEWPQEIRDRQPKALKELEEKLHEIIEKEKFLQYLFFKQWFMLKNYCNHKHIQIIGDIPIYVHYDSADVWKNTTIFKLDEEKKPLFVAGVPPDYFSETGQLWGNPVYRWDTLKENGYTWWIQRIEHTLKLYDWVRIDHFRGFVKYWEIPAGEKTAINGKWVSGPGDDFFSVLLRRFTSLPIIAEDLGVITEDVRELMHRFNLPGMRVLLFAFSEDLPVNPYAPHNHIKNCIVYTGTHDNNTVRGWFENEATFEDKNRVFNYIGHKVSPSTVHWEFIRLAMMSVANIAIIPMQDILGLGQEARMNKPATTKGNYEWRLLQEQLTVPIKEKLLKMTEIYGRTETPTLRKEK
ncbi:MAG: 4-alpha-glucanotransferase [Candidatus Jordarchaeaceae archaeon]